LAIFPNRLREGQQPRAGHLIQLARMPSWVSAATATFGPVLGVDERLGPVLGWQRDLADIPPPAGSGFLASHVRKDARSTYQMRISRCRTP
jgi:hypothetical protein